MGASKIQRRWPEFSLFKWASTEMIYFLLFWYQATSSTFPYPILFWLTLLLHDPVIPYPTWFCFTVYYTILLYRILHDSVLPYPTWFCYTVSYMILFYRILHDSVLPYPTWFCYDLSYTILACRFLPYFILFYPCKYWTFHQQSFHHLPSIFKIPWTSYLIL